MNSMASSFYVPDHLHASAPAECRGQARDSVRLMVLDRRTGAAYHDHFKQLGDYLLPGDLLVLNNSRTIPSVLKAQYMDEEIEVRLSRQVSNTDWEALLVNKNLQIGTSLTFPEETAAIIKKAGSEPPLVTLSFSKSGPELFELFYRYGEPIRYEYVKEPWPLESFQTVYGSVPGSVEMASAGRAITWKMLQQLKKKGIQSAFLQLHAGLTYYGDDRWPTPIFHPEQTTIPKQTAQLIHDTKRNGGRIIAVGTTVVRSLETAVDEYGIVEPFSGVTNLYINDGYRLQVVDGLLTGFHEPEASHLDMLKAFMNPDHLLSAYNEAISEHYLWHEFGDMNLILPLEKER
ncbi:S-adenosylmethionine:tRNA ribosyltransferase-isomerase [Metabacillus arenae]|uniref:S-adenosylmethionine:tRNA ribosyltransferase-isomerase n=1 Tax=Metabacillus arenae TaxID=2771434 RepID=A0A926NQW0_9BACI|nr:S-adenosylmethionine:tRNA ribosyltransferase-isomerase [Metabacillus arenae]MBD1382266.1 S-adenosylmethionine:tRNA ribosyltransferase-isomerase [Metabacillus arenae]